MSNPSSRPRSTFVSRLRKQPALAAVIVIVVIAGIAVGWWLAAPLFIDNLANEAFPLSANATLPANLDQADAEATMDTAASFNNSMDEAIMSNVGDPTILAVGTFRNADDFHRGGGIATIYRLEDGSHVLRFEDFQVTNGPDLRVYLSAHADPLTSSDVREGGYASLGALKGNIGSQNYTIPPGVNLDQVNSVVIYCEPFHVVFSVAPLQPPS